MFKYNYDYPNLKDDEYQNGYYKLGGKGWDDLVHDADLGSSFATYLIGKEILRYEDGIENKIGEYYLLKAVVNGFTRAKVDLGKLHLRPYNFHIGLSYLRDAKESGYDVDDLIADGEKRYDEWKKQDALETIEIEKQMVARGESLVGTEDEQDVMMKEHNAYVDIFNSDSQEKYDREREKRFNQLNAMDKHDREREKEATYDFEFELARRNKNG